MRILKLWLPVIAWAAIILMAANDTLSSTSTAGWFQRTFGFSLGYWPHAIIRKCAHLSEYAFLAFLATRASGRKRYGVLIAMLVAIADETKQSYTIARTGSVWDVVLDTCGAFFGSLAWERWFKRNDR